VARRPALPVVALLLALELLLLLETSQPSWLE
jgi:hypothetical protein